ILSSDRMESDPLVIIGGAAVSLNPEPIAELMDLFIIGDGEGVTLELVERYRENGGRGALSSYASIAGVYVPSLYEVTYDGAQIKEVKAAKGAPEKVKAGKFSDIDKFPMPKTAIITADTSFANTVLMEIEKGCGRFCRFCAAGFLYLPPRWRDFEMVKDSMKIALKEFGKVGLVGAAVSEYPRLKELLAIGAELKGNLTLSSIRADVIDPELLTLLRQCGYKTLTIAPEAGTERGRHIINKCMSEEVILNAARMASEAGFQKLKLYFLAGLPEETDEDVLAIAGLTEKIRGEFGKGQITVSINPFIPKAVTPFQWFPYERVDTLEKRFKMVKKALLALKGVKVSIFSPRQAFFQAVIARGDRRLAQVIIDASMNYNGSLKRALKANKECVPSAEEYAYRERGEREILPWDILDHAIEKDYLYKEYQRGLEAKETGPCIVGACTRCGVC
ncbi:MAG: radical SAM protein, partial [Proteobacteria bacterium]|nr:radical SAM protein [Pseudomonadota bacterium]